MRLRAIESVVINQTILGRIFRYGEVVVTGRGSGDVLIRWVQSPMKVKGGIESLVD
ncbi:PH domain-containing protein [Rubritalea sp.]|uniref:PH domain-containing protein n=1 Tax=Rubritalea sp. TaxID=2109375 RepID=UPI003EF8409F